MVQLLCRALSIGVAAALFAAVPATAASGVFERAWGKDVVQNGAPGDTGFDFEICTIASACKNGAPGGQAGGEMESPSGVAVDSSGNVYVADTGNHRIQKFDAAGNFLRAWGRDVIGNNVDGNFEICVPPVSVCKTGEPGGFMGDMISPQDVAVDSAGNVYVADLGNNRIQKFDSSGNFQRTWGKDVIMNGAGDTGFEVCVVNVHVCQNGQDGGLGGELNSPVGLATDAANNVLVVDNANQRALRYDALGAFERTWGWDVIDPSSPGNVAGAVEICVNGMHTCKAGIAGTEGGTFSSPTGIAVEPSGDILVSEFTNRRVQRFDSSGNFLLAWGRDVIIMGEPGDLGPVAEICTVGTDCKGGLAGGLAGEFNFASGVTTDTTGNIYVGDGITTGFRIQKFDEAASPLRAWGKDVVASGPNNGQGDVFEICIAGIDVCQFPDGTSGLGGHLAGGAVATDAAGNLYVAESNGDRVTRFADPLPPPGGGGVTPTPILTQPSVASPPPQKKCKKGQKLKKGKCVKKRKRKK